MSTMSMLAIQPKFKSVSASVMCLAVISARRYTWSATAHTWAASTLSIFSAACSFAAIMVGILLGAPFAQAAILAGPTTNPSNGNQYYLLTQNNWTGSESE